MNSGKYTLSTSIASVFAGMTLNDIAQLLAFIIAIISGLLAIRHYWFSTKLSQLQIQHYKDDPHGTKSKDCH